MTTDEIMLGRALGHATPEDHVDWAVRRLSDGHDSPSLRILAGLDPTHDRTDIEPYFRQSIEEAGLRAPATPSDPRSTARIIRRLFENGTLSPAQTVHRMSDLHRRAGYADPLLGIWFDLEEELLLEGSGHQGVFYPPEAIAPLDAAVRREWVLFERALRLDLPDTMHTFVHCDVCGYVGAPSRTPETMIDSVKLALPWLRSPPAVRFTCTMCGAERYRSISDPAVRELWYADLEAEVGEQDD